MIVSTLPAPPTHQNPTAPSCQIAMLCALATTPLAATNRHRCRGTLAEIKGQRPPWLIGGWLCEGIRWLCEGSPWKWMVGIQAFPFGGKRPIFRGKLAVSFREGTSIYSILKWSFSKSMLKDAEGFWEIFVWIVWNLCTTRNIGEQPPARPVVIQFTWLDQEYQWLYNCDKKKLHIINVL